MKTKTFIALALIISSISFCSCGSYMTGKSAIMKVEKGMAKKKSSVYSVNPTFAGSMNKLKNGNTRKQIR